MTDFDWREYERANGTGKLMDYLFARLAELEAQVRKIEERRASDAMAAAYSRGGGHGF